MTDVRSLLARVWNRQPPGGYVECRDCGTTLPSDATSCCACGSDDIARYVLSDADAAAGADDSE